MRLTESPFVIGLLASIVAWFARKLNKNLQDVSIVALIASIALTAAVMEKVWLIRGSDPAVYAMSVQLEEFLATLPLVFGPLLGEAGAIFISAQAAYWALQSELMQKATHGTIQVLRLAVGGWTYAAHVFLEVTEEKKNEEDK